MNVDVVTVVALGLVASGLFMVLYSVMNMRSDFNYAQPNRVYNFDYVQPVTGGRERFLAKVISNHKWTSDQIRALNFRSDYRISDKDFKREGNLVTCVMPNGEYRRFWSGRVENCTPVPVGGLLYRFASLI